MAAMLMLGPVLASPALADSSGFASSRDRDGSAIIKLHARDDPDSDGDSGSGSGSRGCVRDDGQQVPCSSELGWWSATYDCYLNLIQVAPLDDPLHPGEGLYRCDPGPLGWGAGPTQVMIWMPVAEAGPDPALLAQEAVDSMRLQGITIGTAPPAGSQGLVNLPVWLWADQPGPTTWGPISATAAAGNVTVTATAQATGVVWSTGDGASVQCGKGAPYSPGAGSASPECAHTYREAGRWPITATTTWRAEWTASTGQTGSESVQTSSESSVDIREARAQITGRD